jgi:hypothetical protein
MTPHATTSEASVALDRQPSGGLVDTTNHPFFCSLPQLDESAPELAPEHRSRVNPTRSPGEAAYADPLSCGCLQHARTALARRLVATDCTRRVAAMARRPSRNIAERSVHVIGDAVPRPHRGEEERSARHGRRPPGRCRTRRPPQTLAAGYASQGSPRRELQRSLTPGFTESSGCHVTDMTGDKQGSHRRLDHPVELDVCGPGVCRPTRTLAFSH